MTSRERVMACLRRERVDRPPFDFEARQSVIERLLDDLGCADYEELLLALGVDLRRTAGPASSIDRSRVRADGYRMNEWGVRVRPGQDFYGSTAIPPLAGVKSVDDVRAYAWPDADSFDFAPVTESCRCHHENYVTYGGWWSPFFHEAAALVGFEEFLVGMHERPAVIGSLIDRVVQFDLEMNRRYFEAAEGNLDILYIGNDFGTQSTLIMSIEMFERFIAPALGKFFTLAHDYGAMMMKHSCGAVEAIIPRLIELGMDILDPVQVTADGMDFGTLVTRYGDRIGFHGAVDTQHLLPTASPAEVSESVRSLSQLARGHAPYIICGSQSYLDDIPTENVLAIYEAFSGNV